jgi:predicted  nucleic acid-binding Zn-ribbon protein
MLNGAKRIKKLIENSSGLSEEIYLIKRDGGQQKLITKKTRTIVNQTEQLLQIKKAAEEQLKEIDKQNLKTTGIYNI